MTDDRAVSAATQASYPRAFAWLCALVGVAAWLYRPWLWRPIGIGDVAEYTMVVRGATSAVGRFWALTDYYAHQHGRFNPVVFAAIALKWSLFPGKAVVWYWLRFAVMSGNVALAYLFLRRVGASVSGGVAGAALFVCSTPSVQGWTLLSIGEPVGTLALLTGLCLAASYRGTVRWGAHATLIAACCVLAVLAKEMLVCAVPVVLVIAACHEGRGDLVHPRADDRTLWLLAWASAGVGVAGLLVLWAARLPRAGFSSAYGLHNVSGDVWARFVGAVFPVTASGDSEFLPAVLANASFAVVLWLGARRALAAGPRQRRREAAWAAVALLTPVVGAVLYAPWPTYIDAYSIPMLVGSVLLIGRAVTSAAMEGRASRALVVAVWAGVLAIAGTVAWPQARRAEAERRVADATIRAIAFSPGIHHVVLRSRDTTTRVWATGAQLWSLYARALYDRPFPAAATVACRAALLPGTGSVIIVTSAAGCGTLAAPTQTYRAYFYYFDWKRLRPARDSVRVDLRHEPVAAGSALDRTTPVVG